MTTIALLFYALYEQHIDFRLDEQPFQLSKYYAQCREKYVKRVHWYFGVWFVYAWYSAMVFYYVPMYAYTKTSPFKNGRVIP